MPRAVVTRMADVTAQPVRWLWPSRIPLGMLTILDGDPGLGKSTVLLDLASRLSRGDLMPDDSSGPGIMGTVILSAEDDVARVIRPRLEAAGADVEAHRHSASSLRGVARRETPRFAERTLQQWKRLSRASAPGS